jgi:branched-chain amino acid transport system permease protein
MSGALVTLIALALAVVGFVVWARRDLAHDLATSYAFSHRRFRTTGSKVALFIGALILFSAPIGFSWIGIGDLHLPKELIPGLPLNEKWTIVGINAATYTIGALGMNLLIGNTGQVSLGHSGFIALGAYSIGYFGTDLTIGGKHIPSWLWVLIAGVLGALLSAAIGPFALRLRGNYLAMVSLLLVFGAEHVIKNWESFTGGDVAPRNDLPGFTLTLFPDKPIRFRDQGEVSVFDVFFAPEGTSWVNRYYYWLCLAFAAIAVVVARNILRSRQGRAMMAVRDRDLSAEVIGVRQMYTKTGAFAVSGAFAAVSGALYASHLGSVQPASFALGFSIQFIAMIVIGGVGSVLGSVLGAISIAAIFDLIKASQPVLENLPFIQLDPAKRGLTLDLLSVLLYGVLIVVFLIYFPTGIAGVWQRVRRYFATWPFR